MSRSVGSLRARGALVTLVTLGLALAACARAAPAPSTPAPPSAPAPAPAASAGAASPTPAPARAPAPPRPALALTYLGVAGWQLEGGGRTILTDPYFSRPRLDGPILPDPEAIARRSPPRADLILVGHSHVDHLLDAPTLALRLRAPILGSLTTAHVARATGVPPELVIPVKGGEDYDFGDYSVRVIPSLHSALDDKRTVGGALTAPPKLPLSFAQYEEGGTFIYLVRLAGRQVLVTSTANFIERELEGLRPDIAIVATGLRQEIHDYTCRLLRVLGHPPLVYTTHFDEWRAPAPAGPVPPSDDLRAFVEEARRCSPGTRVVVPAHFERMLAP